jgi:hypothetical protein
MVGPARELSTSVLESTSINSSRQKHNADSSDRHERSIDMTYQIEGALCNESTLLPKYLPPTYPAPMQQIFTIVAGLTVSNARSETRMYCLQYDQRLCKGDTQASLPVAAIYLHQ